MNGWRIVRGLLCLLLAGLVPVAAAAESAWTWGGSLRSLNLSGERAPADLYPSYRLSSTRLRLETAWQEPSGWRLDAAADLQLLGTDPAGSVPLPGDGVNRRVDLDHSWQHDAGWASRLQIDRLSLGWSGGRLDVTLGRQAIGFGRILIVSPLDVIAPFPPDALDTDVRPGVDALRVSGHYGLDGQLGAVAVRGDHSRHDSYLLTWADNYGGLDLLALGGELRQRPMLGIGLAGSLGTLGLKGEAALYQGTRVGEVDGDRHRHMLISAVEAWYRFAGGLTLVTQYLHNGAGTGEPGDYPAVVLSAPVQEGLTTLLGRHYLLAAPSFELHPLATLNALLIWNLADDSWLLRPTLELSLADNVSLELFWTHAAGRSPRRQPFPLPAVPRSEFGSQGDSAGLFLKWFF
jgi:hypothetical protein